MQIDLTGIASLIASLAFAVLLRVGYAFIRAHVHNQWLADMLDRELGNALGMMQQATQVEINTASELHPTLNPLTAVGVNFMLKHATEAVQNMSPDMIADKIDAKVGIASIATNLAVAGSPTPDVPHPLDPVHPAGTMTTRDLNLESAGLAAGQAGAEARAAVSRFLGR